MTNIILHIGTPKSGTSALQNFLNDNNEALAEHNLYYPKDLHTKNSEITMGNGRKLYEYAQGNNISDALKYIDKLKKQYLNKTIILSSEGFYFHPEFIHKLIPDATVIVYFREQSEKIVSSYGQIIKGDHSFSKDFSQYFHSIIDDNQDKAHSQYFLDAWANHFLKSAFIVRPYDFDQFIEGSIFSDFLESIGVKDKNRFIFPDKRINISYCRDALEYKLLINKLISNLKSKYNHMIREVLQNYSEKFPDSQKTFLMSKQQQAKITEHFKDTNTYIARRYLNRQNGILFQNIKDIDNKSKDYKGLSINHIQRITRYSIHQKPVLLEYIIDLVTKGLCSKDIDVKKAAYSLSPIFALHKIYMAINPLKEINMKEFSVYGNCQSGAMALTLMKNKDFCNIYNFKELKFIQNIKEKEIYLAKNKFLNSDLLIHQYIHDSYKIPPLSTSNLMKLRKKNSITISFVSLYFNAYFPHLDTFLGKESILNQVHDYIIMYCFAIGLTEKQTLDLIQSDTLYDKKTSQMFLSNSLDVLRKRENSTDIKITDFIEAEYKNIKLFNQFNHPKGIIFDHLANQVFKQLGISEINESIHSRTGLDGIMSPMYRSTYKNLGLLFEEDFSTYTTTKGILKQDRVIEEFYTYYRTIDKNLILDTVKNKKPFIVDMFKNLDI